MFCVPKAAVLHGKSVGFASQKSRFRNVKAQLSLFNRIIFTKRYKKNDLQMLNIGSCKSFRLEINIPPFVSTPVRYYRLTVGQKEGY
ncbi:hypothetical protein CTI16_12255 [Prevotella intermedia]|uniref:Uncharacterized protein n=1 Tax=Prevotella intermedia TaxID=28131 RepID=A0AAJ3RGP6_PREIN|nr:hypothetical protein CTI16_12255 [Prevotella intermedia]